MFAVIKTGGKQYKVKKDDLIVVEKLDAEVGQSIKLEDVILLSTDKGIKTTPKALGKAFVEAEVIRQGKDDKVIIFKKKRRQNYRRKAGHRQHITTLRVSNISAGTAAKAKPAAAVKPEATAQETKQGE